MIICPRFFLGGIFFSNISWENSHQLPFLSDGCLEKSLGCLSLPLTLILRQSPFIVHHCVLQVICGRSFPEFSCFQLPSHQRGARITDMHPAMSGVFVWVLGIQAQGLTFVGQVFHPQSQLPWPQLILITFFFSDCVTFTSSVLTDFFSWKMHTQTHVQWEKQQVKMKIKEKKNTS